MLSLLLSTALAKPMVAVVVVDEEARDEGYALALDGWVIDDALPVDVADGEVLELVAPGGYTEELDLKAGEAWEVSGPDGEAWMSMLDDEIRTDLIAVRGEPAAIDALAESLDADVVEHADGLWLSGEDILLDAGWVDDELALSVDEVAFVRVRRSEQADAGRPATGTRRLGAGETGASKPEGTLPSSSTGVDERRRADRKQSDSTPEAAAMPEEAAEPAERPPPRAAVGKDAHVAYGGNYLCRQEPLWLHPSGTWAFRGVTGSWRVVAPGVVRLESWAGELWWRAAIGPDDRYCRDVWSPLGDDGWRPLVDDARLEEACDEVFCLSGKRSKGRRPR